MTSPETELNPGAATGRLPNYLNARRGILSWLLTTDHKRIGLLYFMLIGVLFIFGMTMGILIRLELIAPGRTIFGQDVYNRILTLHGVAMIFLFIIPGLPAIFGNFFLPIMIGAEDVAFPRINLLSWYCYVSGALLAVVSIALGGPDTGWTFYVPYSIQTTAQVMLPLIAVFMLGWSSILTGLNFVTTVHRLRAPGIEWGKLPLFVWSLYATAWVQIIATPVIGLTVALVAMDRAFDIGYFDPSRGGDPLLFQHLFWIYSHPAVYIMILPGMGVVSEIIPTFSRKSIFGYWAIAYSSMAIAAVGSLVWGHHMFTSGMADEGRAIFSLLTFLVAIPSAVKVFNWTATLYGGSIRFEPPLLFALMFIFLFSIGGLTGLIQGVLTADIHLHDTSFIVAHFHYTMFGGTGVAFFAALCYWWPKMFGVMYNRAVAFAAAIGFFIGFNITYFSLFLAGMAGMPRRYADYPLKYFAYHHASTIGSWIMVASILTLFGALVHALVRGRPAPPDPWGGATIEWRTRTPPPTLNFDGLPDTRRGPYEYP